LLNKPSGLQDFHWKPGLRPCRQKSLGTFRYLYSYDSPIFAIFDAPQLPPVEIQGGGAF